MIKKSIFVVLVMFGFSSVADMEMHSESDHMSDMMNSSNDAGEEAGMTGGFELKFDGLADMKSSYRVYLGWKGDVNEYIQWGVSVGSGLEQAFDTPNLNDLHLNEAYVSYKPVEGLSFKAGKYNWMSKFNKTGILYDDDLYVGGVSAKYHYGDRDSTGAFAKAALYKLSEGMTGPFGNDTILKVKAGGHYVAEDMMGKVYVSAEHDGLFKGDTEAEAKTLMQAGVNLTASFMEFPVGAFVVYVSDTAEFGSSFNAGVYLGEASTPRSGEGQDFGLSVSYYDIGDGDHNKSFVDQDYISLGEDNSIGKGIAVRAQYNVWDNTNVVAKYVHNLTEGVKADDANRLVAELTFNF